MLSHPEFDDVSVAPLIASKSSANTTAGSFLIPTSFACRDAMPVLPSGSACAKADDASSSTASAGPRPRPVAALQQVAFVSPWVWSGRIPQPQRAPCQSAQLMIAEQVHAPVVPHALPLPSVQRRLAQQPD